MEKGGTRKFSAANIKAAFGPRQPSQHKVMVKNILATIARICELRPESKESERLILSPLFAQVNIENTCFL